MKLIFDKSVAGRKGVDLPPADAPGRTDIDASYMRSSAPELPELSELDVVRHFSHLSSLNFGVDSGFYPLGSCTMKYNPKMCETIAADARFASLHPMLTAVGGFKHCQGALGVLHHMDVFLREICGMAAFTTQPLAGANGELTGALIMAAYHRAKGNTNKKVVLIPDTAHGTNPASASIAGFDVKTIKSDCSGDIDLDALRHAIDETVAGVMLTAPSTLGLFNPNVHKIAELVHSVDALMYYDGANLNAIVGRCRPGDLGFDVLHLNLHKTFATPHGGGGPGSGPVGVCEKLVPFLPSPCIVKSGTEYSLNSNLPQSIGQVAPFFGNFSIILRAYAYILRLGREGLANVSELAVLNANYIRHRLKDYFDLPHDQRCMHEVVFSASRQADKGVHALDIAKALIDRGFHPMTIYFPLIVSEAMMIEPTETESLETIEAFCDVMIELAKLAEDQPERFKDFPTTTPVSRLDETKAARQIDVACL